MMILNVSVLTMERKKARKSDIQHPHHGTIALQRHLVKTSWKNNMRKLLHLTNPNVIVHWQGWNSNLRLNTWTPISNLNAVPTNLAVFTIDKDLYLQQSVNKRTARSHTWKLTVTSSRCMSAAKPASTSSPLWTTAQSTTWKRTGKAVLRAPQPELGPTRRWLRLQVDSINEPKCKAPTASSTAVIAQ